MAIEFILGASGTGKTRYIYEKMIVQSKVEGHAPIWFVLPEQSNMAAEQDMVSLHPNGGTMDISIVSFTRMAFKVFDERNVHTSDILDDYGKSILLMKVLKEHEKEFTYYGKMIGKSGFVEETKSMLSELYQYQVTENVLEEVMGGLSPEQSLYHKLSDMKIILTAFEKAMGDSYMVAEQILSLLSETVQESELLRGAEIYFDGFTGFTPIQYQVIEALMKHAANLHFVFTMDGDLFGNNGYGENELFALGKESMDRLCKLAEENQVKILPHISLETNYRLQNVPELEYLERQLFRFPVKSYGSKAEAIRICAAEDAEEEIYYIAKTIKEYVLSGQYRYRDFAIVTGDMGEQAAIWHMVMQQLEIPYFMDVNEVFVHNPVAEITNMVLDLFIRDFAYESVFAFLKTGFFSMEKDDIYLLENYALKYGVRGYSWWKNTFQGNIKGLGTINAARKQFMDLLEPVADVFSKPRAKAKEYLAALYEFMVTHEMASKLQIRSEEFEQQGMLREAKSYAQVYDKFIQVLDKTMDILGEEEISRETLREMLAAGMAELRLGAIPSTLDQVVIGDMERTRFHYVKILFVAGANEGLLPANSTKQGILADKDRRQLAEQGLELAPDSKKDIFVKQFYIYLQLTQAGEQLILCYRKTDAKGAELRPSYFMKRILQMYPDIIVESAKDWLKNMLPSTKEEMTKVFAGQLEQEDRTDASVYRMMLSTQEQMTKRMIEGYLYENRESVLDRSIAKQLYGTHMVHSVSRLETYAGCAYQFFLQYGIRIAKREEYQMESNNIGTILHAVMEDFFQMVQKGKINLGQITEEERNTIVETLVRNAAKEENDTIFDSSFRNRHQLEVLIRIAKRSVGHLCRHLTEGKMQPAYFEKEFSPADKIQYTTMLLPDNVQMELKGFIDRVDITETEDAVYVKVIDYKSGAKDIDYVKMYEGKQLQLTVYMSVMLEFLQRKYPDKKIIPTGMYYYHIYDPIIEEMDETKLEQKRMESNRLTGLVNEDDTCLDLMDARTGSVTPVRYKKDGDFDSRNTALVSTEELKKISSFIRNKMMEIGEQIIQGEIAMNPEKGELSSPCNYCDYKNICRFEPGLGGNAYRIAPQIDRNEAKQFILEGEEVKEHAMDEGSEKDH